MSEATVTLIGFTAATLTTAAFVPQAFQTIRTKKTKDLSLGMYTAVTCGVFFWLVYGLLINDPPMYVANGITFILASIILYLKIKHG